MSGDQISRRDADKRLDLMNRRLDMIDLRLKAVHAMLVKLVEALAEHEEPDPEDIHSLDGTPMGRARDQSESL